MRIAPVIALLTLLFAASAVYATNHTNGTDPCAGVTCNTPPSTSSSCDGNTIYTTTYQIPGTCSNGACAYSYGPTTITPCGNTTTTCPDGYVAGCLKTCSQSGSSATCNECTPSCAGHETTNPPANQTNTSTISVTHTPSNPTTDAALTVLATSSAASNYIYIYFDGTLVKTCSSATSCTYVVQYPTAGTHTYYATFIDSTTRNTQTYSFIVSGPTNTTYANNCADTDGGQNYNQRGSVTYNLNYAASSQYTLTDSCSGSTLNEYYCRSDGTAQTAYYTCPTGCFEGACNAASTSECTSGQTETGTCPDGVTYTKRTCAEGRWNYVNYFADPCAAYKGYRYAKWTCSADFNSTLQGSETSCRDTETWKSYAEDFCRNRGGVSSFIVDGECSQNAPAPTLACPPGCRCEKDGTGIMHTYCDSQQACNYNSVCERGEEYGCKDCVTGRECPIQRKCSDGSTVTCYGTASTCTCEQCPIPANDLPFGCRQEKDDGGFIRVVCDNYRTSCPAIDSTAKARCSESGGTPVIRRGYNSCEYFYCDFGDHPTGSIFSGAQCQTAEEMSNALHKCEELGLRGAVAFENGCKIGRCLEHRTECPATGETDKREMERKCSSEGKKLVYGYNNNGCQELRCEETNYCENDLPREAYEKCAQHGGQLLVKRDDKGCVAFNECVRRGDTSKTYVDKITRIPDSSELLSMAFKLEDLKLQLDGLSRKSGGIADYYKTTASTDEERFRRVSGMFSAAAGRVDEIKTKIRGRLNNLNNEDLVEIKRDIRYIKDVIIKDILYVMLSTGDDIDKIKSDEKKDCGRDMECFNDALRICQPVTFLPDEESGIRVELRGLEDNKCVLYASAGPLDMNCKLEKYSLGVSDPETDVLPYCSGSLVAVVKAQMSNTPSNGLQAGVQAGVQSGLQAGVQSGLQAGIQGGLQAGVQSGLQAGVQAGVQCVGCFNNRICDAGECPYCQDCL